MEQLDLFAVLRVPLFNRRGDIVGYTLIDAVDADLIMPFKWHLLRVGRGYARRKEGDWRYGTERKIFVHREILGLPRYRDGREGDHKNRDSLDNRRENLRIVTHGQNQQNMSSARNSTSQYRGVSWDRYKQLWCGSVNAHGRRVFIQFFRDEESAHRAVIEVRKKYLPFSIED